MSESQGSRRKTGWLLGLMMVITVSVTGVNAYFLLNGRDSTAVPAAEAVAVPSPEPIFVKIDPFTVNLQADDYGPRLLYTGLSLKVGNTLTRDMIATHMPQIRNRLLLLLSGQDPEEITSAGGKAQLAARILEQLRLPLAEPQPELLINDVLFTEFIVQ
ncbi:flagellar basal body-associated protein FliL [Zobellella aerophila]|uniref:Flagellar protein FliL n=1 Tax=Zobellella aerophila TaxID=870480 RepID=A0ABP6VW38_9GAMM